MIYTRGQLPTREKVTPFDDLLIRYLNEQDHVLDSVLNGGIRLDENFDGVFVTYTTNASPDTEDAITHDLKKVPVGFQVIDIDNAGIIYRSATSTDTQIFLKCSTASATVTIFVF